MADWMDDATRDSAIDKAKAMKYSVGYPDFILDSIQLDAYYSQVGLLHVRICLHGVAPKIS